MRPRRRRKWSSIVASAEAASTGKDARKALRGHRFVSSVEVIAVQDALLDAHAEGLEQADAGAGFVALEGLVRLAMSGRSASTIHARRRASSRPSSRAA